MLLRRIYIMSLEHPGPGFFGIVGRVGTERSLKDLDLFIRGYIQSDLDANRESPTGGWADFINWIDSRGYSSPQGWALQIADESGDGVTAFNKFKQLLFEFLEAERPEWFIQYNLSKQPSAWFRMEVTDGDYENATTVPTRDDIRAQEHVLLAANLGK